MPILILTWYSHGFYMEGTYELKKLKLMPTVNTVDTLGTLKLGRAMIIDKE